MKGKISSTNNKFSKIGDDDWEIVEKAGKLAGLTRDDDEDSEYWKERRMTDELLRITLKETEYNKLYHSSANNSLISCTVYFVIDFDKAFSSNSAVN